MNNDMYAVIMMRQDYTEPKFVGEALIMGIKEMEKTNFDIKYCLYETEKKAQGLFFEMLRRDRDGLIYIKISKMNRHNLKSESEVLMYKGF